MANQNTRPRRDEDIDDFMANLLSGSSSPLPEQQQRRILKRPQTPANTAGPTAKRQPMPEAKHQLKKSVKFLSIFVLIVGISAGLFFAWQGPISGLLEPRSPFTQELKDNMSVPLYYPTELPGTFKMELGSITQPESDVTLYVISNEEGKRINITLQKQPEGLNLDPLYNVLSDTTDLDTKFGSIKKGTSTEGTDIANILTGPTWIIINCAKDTISNEDLVKLIDHLKS